MLKIFNFIKQKQILYAFLILLSIFNFTSENRVTNSSRDFFSSYLQTFKGKDWRMDINCLSGEFDELTKELLTDFENKNWIKFAMTLSSVIKLEKESCPIEDIEGIVEDLKIAINNGSSLTNTLKNISLIEEELKEFFASGKTAALFGQLLGKLTKIVVYGL